MLIRNCGHRLSEIIGISRFDKVIMCHVMTCSLQSFRSKGGIVRCKIDYITEFRLLAVTSASFWLM